MGAAMGHYKSNLRDLEFNLFEVLRRQDLLGHESFADADRHPPVFDPATASVRMPEGFKKSFAAFMDAEWFRLDLPAELGGIAAPRTLAWSVAELILGANPAVWMYSGGPNFAQVLWRLGTPDQKRFAEQAI